MYIGLSSLLKLANCSTHGGETWCACVFHRFHDYNNFLPPSSLSFSIFSLPPLSQSDTNQDLPLLNELILLAYGEEVLTSNPVAFPPLTVATNIAAATSTTSGNLQENLIQDCMWSGHLCERRSLTKKPLAPLASVGSANSSLQNTPRDSGTGGAVYTPAPSPSPPASVVVGGDSSHDDDSVESDCCVSPSVVFPSILTSPTKILPRVGSKVDTTVATETTEATTTASSPMKKSMSVLRNSSKAERDDPDWEESGDEIGGRHGYERGQQRRKRKLSSAAMVAMGANSRIQPQSTESSTSGESCLQHFHTKSSKKNLVLKHESTCFAECPSLLLV